MPTQALAFGRVRFAQIFGLPPDKVLVRSPFLGGGFGGKGLMSGPIVLGALAAKLTGRPVKLVATRAAALRTVRPSSADAPAPAARRRRRRAADRARASRERSRTSSFDDFYEPSADISHTLYASPGDPHDSHEAVRLDTGTPLFMRAPGEASGSIALESAIDEMAFA